MSIELTLVPLAIVAGVIVRRELEKRRQNEHYMQTVMKDSRLLYQVLTESGCEVEPDGAVLTTTIGEYPVSFSKDSQGAYAVVINGEMETEDAMEILAGVERKYGKALQEEEYQKLMAGAQLRGYELLTNEMLPNKAIHVVFNVPGTTGGHLDVQAMPDGRLEVHVKGIKGPKCAEYAGDLERMLEARAEDSSYTEEYYQADEVSAAEKSPLRLEDE